MKSKAIILVALGMAGPSMQALADDSPADRPVMTHKQLMKECMDTEKADNNGASHEALKKTCNEKIKAYRNHPSETRAPADTPRT